MIEILSARDGSQTARHGVSYLHSRYNPINEARKYLDSQLGESLPGTFVLLGPGLDYLSVAIEERFPDAKTITVFYSETCSRVSVSRAKYRWYPGSDESLGTFFNRVLPDWGIEGVKVIEWEPIAQVYPGIAASVRDELSSRIRQITGNIVTTAAFGRLWVTNAVKNFLRTDSFLPLPAVQRPICIAASGPSLEESMPVFLEKRDQITLWALPSSINALSARGIIPDLIVQTDAGFYARHHMYLLDSIPDTVVGMPLSASVAPNGRIPSAVIFNQDSFFENDLLISSGYRAPRVPWNGTVAGTAFNLALRYHLPIYFAGLDLSNRDIVSHARPHSFDTLFSSRISRYDPGLSILTERAFETYPIVLPGNIRTSKALQTYAAWFSHIVPDRNTQVYRISPSSVKINGMIEIQPEDFSRILDHTTVDPVSRETDPPVSLRSDRKREIASQAIANWKKTVEEMPRKERPIWKHHDYEILHTLSARYISRLQKVERTDNQVEYRRITTEMTENALNILNTLERMIRG